MIFSNSGLTQIGGGPLTNVAELAFIINTIKQRASEANFPEAEADNMIVLAGKLSQRTIDEIVEFINAAESEAETAGAAPSFAELLKRFDETFG